MRTLTSRRDRTGVFLFCVFLFPLSNLSGGYGWGIDEGPAVSCFELGEIFCTAVDKVGSGLAKR